MFDAGYRHQVFFFFVQLCVATTLLEKGHEKLPSVTVPLE